MFVYIRNATADTNLHHFRLKLWKSAFFNNVIYAIFGVITKENFNQSYSAPPPRCAAELYYISVD